MAKAVKQVIDGMDQAEVKSNVQIDCSVASDFRYEYFNKILNMCLKKELSGSVWEAYWFEIDGGGSDTVISLSIFILATDDKIKVNKCCIFRLCMSSVRVFSRIYAYLCSNKFAHYYTNDIINMSELSDGEHYRSVGISFYLLRHQDHKTVPLYRNYKEYNKVDGDWTLSISISARQGKILGYCFEKKVEDDLVPLYRYCKLKGKYPLHFYTTDETKIGSGLKVGERGNFGYMYRGIECYVFPPSYVMDSKRSKIA